MLWKERTSFIGNSECAPGGARTRMRIPGSPISGRHGHARSKTRSANAAGEAAGSFHEFCGAAWHMTAASIADARGASAEI
jgi:hypothetical protein